MVNATGDRLCLSETPERLSELGKAGAVLCSLEIAIECTKCEW